MLRKLFDSSFIYYATIISTAIIQIHKIHNIQETQHEKFQKLIAFWNISNIPIIMTIMIANRNIYKDIEFLISHQYNNIEFVAIKNYADKKQETENCSNTRSHCTIAEYKKNPVKMLI